MEIVISKPKKQYKKLDARIDNKSGFIWTKRGTVFYKT